MNSHETDRRSPVRRSTSTRLHALSMAFPSGVVWRMTLALILSGGLLLIPRPHPVRADIPSTSEGEAALRVLFADASGVELALDVPAYRVERVMGSDAATYARLSVHGFDTTGTAGRPDLPAHSVLLAVPPGVMLDLQTEVLAERTDRLSDPVYPAPALVADQPAELPPDSPLPPVSVREGFMLDQAAYAAAGLEPAEPAILEEAGYARDLRVARLTVYPLQYRAATRELRHVQRMRLHVRFIGANAPGISASLVPNRTVSQEEAPVRLLTGDLQRAADPSQFGDLLRQIVVNPEWVDAWRADIPASMALAASPMQPVAEGPRYRITLRETGIYRLTYADLQAAGLPLTTLDPRQLSIYRGGQELAIDVPGEVDGRFDPGDQIRFFAEAVKSFYTDVNTLWLVVGTRPGLRMAQRSVVPQGGIPASSFSATQHVEADLIYRSSMPMASDVDHWYWGQMYVLNQTRVATMTVSFVVTDPLPVGTARLALELWGGSTDPRVTPDHHVRVYVNGSLAGDVTWVGAVRAMSQVTFDQAFLRDGENTLTLYTPGDTGARDAAGRLWESNWLNFFDLTYDRSFLADANILDFTPPAGPGEYAISGWSGPDEVMYDVTDAVVPVRLTGATAEVSLGGFTLRMADVTPPGGRYYVAGAAGLRVPLVLAFAPPSDLLAPSEGADYLLITHPDFLTGVQSLAQFRRDQGLRVRVVNVQDVYDEFSGGLLDPHAIRDFIRYAYFNWPGPAPAYVLLAGDGTYDFLNHEGFGARTFIPPYLDNVDPVLGETAADNRYVTVVGDDAMPDLHLGRLPVNDQTELAAMVNKIIAYEADPAPGAWRTQAVFVTDNNDNAGHFDTLSDAAAAYVPPEFSTRKIYLGSAEYPTNQAVRAQQATLEAFNGGPLLFNFVGHSAISNWAAEILFGVNALPSVTNTTFPVVLPMTCLEGAYQNPRFVGVGESVVRLSGRGAIASWSPTGLGVATGHDYLHRGFYDALFNWDVSRLGPATTAGKLYLFTNAQAGDGSPRFRDLLDTYVLLGDPATRINVPDANLSISAVGPAGPLMQGDPVTYAVTYRNESPARVKGVVIDASLPAVMTDVAWSASDGTLSLRPGSRLMWDMAELAPGVTGEITITGNLAGDVLPGNRSVSAEMSINSRWHESDYRDNQAGPLVAELAPGDLVLKQVTEPATPVAPGEWVTFTLGYVNLGPSSATGVRLNLPLPVALDDLRLMQTGPSAILRPGTSYEWDLATMQPGEKGRTVISGRIPHTITWDQVHWSVSAQIVPAWPDYDLTNNIGDTGTIDILVGDSFEPDNSRAEVQPVDVPLPGQPHTMDPLGDQDWVVFHAQAGMTYGIRTAIHGSAGDTVLFLWDKLGNLLAKNDDIFPGSGSSQVTWTAPETGDFYVMVASAGSTVGFSYRLYILALPWQAYLPLMTSQK
jgi:uncharacterized repeat protein (TIGR01451 family)